VVTSAQDRATAPARRPVTPRDRRTHTAWTVLLPLVCASAIGVVAGLAPLPVLVVTLGAAVVCGIVLELEWAALVVVSASVFEDYLVRVDPRAVKVLGVLLVLAWIVRRCSGRLQREHHSPVLVAALVFVVALLVSTLVHNNGDTGTAVVVRYAGFLVVLLVLSDVLRGRLAPERLARAYVAACTAAAVCGLLTYALAEDPRVGGPIADPNDFAFFLLPAVPLAFALRRRGRHGWMWSVAAVIVVLAVIGTLSRGALLGLVAMGVFALATRMVRLRAAVGLAVVLVALVALTAAFFPSLVETSLHQKGHVADQNVSERLALWREASQMTLDRPLVGMGPGAFSLDHGAYSPELPDDVNHPLDVAHNTWLEISSELGLFGLAAFVAMLSVAFAQAWSGWRRARDPMSAAVSAALVGAAVAATFVTEQYYLPLWLLCALAVGVGSRSAPCVDLSPGTAEGED
jgi:putative inorganic carbon (HCO3(-)) transporter